MIRRILPGLLLSCLLAGRIQAQTASVISEQVVSHRTARPVGNMIGQESGLEQFFSQLDGLRTHHTGVVNILHIGDSHLQADFLTNVLRKNFQYEFGNAGRGLVVPLHVARTNEPHTFKTICDTVWESKRCTFPDQPLPIGIGGVTVRNAHPGRKITVQIRSDSSLGYQFDRVRLFCLRDEHSFDYRILDDSGAVLGTAQASGISDSQSPITVQLPELNDQFTLEPVRTADQQNHATLFGFSLENGQPGVLYHTVGVNGAQYSHYKAATYFAEQTKGLAPNLIVISLGTNEAFAPRLTGEEFYSQIDGLVQSLRKANPEASILLTTPADSFKSYRRRRVPNPKMAEVRETILRYATDHQLPCWDLYGITGPATYWQKNHLIQRDGVHYTRQGYELQGRLLYDALMNSFNQYVANRPR
jgi:lysophospholipase L1-like esterase